MIATELELGATAELGDHTIHGVEGELPCNDVVWECEYCGLRGTVQDVFVEEHCETDE